jgi:hypothetical protein
VKSLVPIFFAAGLVLPCAAGVFDQFLEGEGFSVRIQSPNATEKNTITLEPKGLKSTNEQLVLQVDGEVTRSFLADMDGDNTPELFIVLTNPGSGSYGSVIAYSTNGRKSLTPIIIEEPAEKDLVGYMGHDEFEVMENTFVRRFPLYKEGDTNANPTGGHRQFQYKLKAGEAAWQLKIERMESY